VNYPIEPELLKAVRATPKLPQLKATTKARKKASKKAEKSAKKSAKKSARKTELQQTMRSIAGVPEVTKSRADIAMERHDQVLDQLRETVCVSDNPHEREAARAAVKNYWRDLSGPVTKSMSPVRPMVLQSWRNSSDPHEREAAYAELMNYMGVK
jgi:hypothetical protein